jgi:hypothetical protein
MESWLLWWDWLGLQAWSLGWGPIKELGNLMAENHGLSVDKESHARLLILTKCLWHSVGYCWPETPRDHQILTPKAKNSSNPSWRSRTSWWHEENLWEVFFGILGFELRPSCLGRCSASWVNPPALFCEGVFKIRIKVKVCYSFGPKGEFSVSHLWWGRSQSKCGCPMFTLTTRIIGFCHQRAVQFVRV